MNIKHHTPEVAEIVDLSAPIARPEELMELMAEHDCTAMIIRRKQLPSEFFQLASGWAGEALQKISTYRLRLAVVGDFAHVQSKPLRDFIGESNRQKRVIFVPTVEAALAVFTA